MAGAMQWKVFLFSNMICIFDILMLLPSCFVGYHLFLLLLGILPPEKCGKELLGVKAQCMSRGAMSGGRI